MYYLVIVTYEILDMDVLIFISSNNFGFIVLQRQYAYDFNDDSINDIILFILQ